MDMAARLVARFRGIAVERLERLNNAFVELQQQHTTETEQLVKREVHTLKGEARMTGFRQVSDVAHHLEELLRQPGYARDQRADLIFRGFDLMGVRIDKPPSSDDDPEVDAYAVDVANALAAVKQAPVVQEPSVAWPPVFEPDTPSLEAQATVMAETIAVEDITDEAELPDDAPQPGQPAQRKVSTDEALRVSLSKLDQLTEAAGDLLLAHGRQERGTEQLSALLRRWESIARRSAVSAAGIGAPENADHESLVRVVSELQAGMRDLRELGRQLSGALKVAGDDTFDTGLKLFELEDRVRELRFLPMSSLFARFPRLVRDLAAEQEKSARLEVAGGAVELDKQILDKIAEPLLHLVANAVDHGLELPAEREAAGKNAAGSIRLSARQTGSLVEITVRDDGRGVDPDKVRAALVRKGLFSAEDAAALSKEAVLDQLFSPGFSTRDRVTDVSGRGVGASVVKETIESLGGTVTIESWRGRGTRFRLQVPTSVVLSRVLVVEQNDARYALPSDLVGEVAMVEPASLEFSGSTPRFRDSAGLSTPVADLARVLGAAARPTKGRISVLVLEHLGRRVGLKVDRFVGQFQVIQRPVDPFVAGVRLFTGTIALGTGELALLLNAGEILRRMELAAPWQASAAEEEQEGDGIATVLVVDDSEFTRDLVVGVVRDMGFHVVEAVNGRQGVTRFLEHRPALVLSDLDMPVLTGFGMIEELRCLREGVDVPIIVFSTRGSAEDKERCTRLGADAYLVKTEFTEERLQNMIHRFIDAPEG